MSASSRDESHRIRSLGWVIIAGLLLYLCVDVALAFLLPQYSLIHNAESDYGSGKDAWIMNFNFVLRGGVSLALVYALWQVPHGKSGLRTAGLTLLTIWAVCSALLALFPDDPAGTAMDPSGRMHLRLATIAFAGILFGAILLSLSFRRDPFWEGAWKPLLAIALAAVVPLLLLGRTGFGVQSAAGLYERLFLGLELLWIGIAAFRLTRGIVVPAPQLAERGP